LYPVKQNYGIYNVTLTIANHFDTVTLVKTSYISVDSIPVVPHEISGPASICHENIANYSIPPIPNASGYVWTIPPGATGNSTTNSIDVTFGSGSSSGNIAVKAINSCGEGQNTSMFIQVIPLVGPAGDITGNTGVCPGENDVSYSVSPIANADQYTWTLPPGASGSSTTNTILISFDNNAQSGDISVAGINTCGTGTASSLTISINPYPSPAIAVYGDSLVCEGADSVYYYTDPIPNADSYFWTIPNSASGSSNTNEIYLRFDLASICDAISVKGMNSCGYGNAALTYVCVAPLPVILEQPHDTTINILGNASFSIPYVSELIFQWQVSFDDGITWDPVMDTLPYSGGSSHELLISGAQPNMNGWKYRVYVSGECEPSLISDTVKLSVIPPGWELIETDIFHTLKIPLNAHPTINGEPVSVHDYVGVFYESGRGLQCGGTMQWNGMSTIEIRAFGNDTLITEKDGFYPGEAFTWKIYSQDWADSYLATPSYFIGPSVFTENSISVLSGLTAIAYYNHIINIPAGWSGISSYILPINDTLENILDTLGTNLRVMMDLQNIYWPDEQINTIVNWDSYSGYKIKVDTAIQLCIKGLVKADLSTRLSAGWNLIPVLSDKNVSTIQNNIFSSLGDTLTIVKEIAGSKLYWPDEDILTLDLLEIGTAYLAHVTDSCWLIFPEDDLGFLPDNLSYQPESKSPWNEIYKSPASHVFSLTSNAISGFQNGDIIGGFESNGLCAGFSEINNIEKNNSLVLFGDDFTTWPEKEGFIENETIKFKLYQAVTGRDYVVEAVFDQSLSENNYFTSNGLSRIIDFQIIVENHDEDINNINVLLYPNPVEDILNILIHDEHNQSAHLKVFSITGELLITKSLSPGVSKIDMSNLAKGIYLTEIQIAGHKLFDKILKK